MIQLRFDAGTILIESNNLEQLNLIPGLAHDPRVNAYRTLAYRYGLVTDHLKLGNQNFSDRVQANLSKEWKFRQSFSLRPYQQAALDQWKQASNRGVIVLPTGVGKTMVGMAAIASAKVAAIVIVPTIDLLGQWASTLERYFSVPIGMLGGGSKEIQDITVSTYDSASIMMEFIGNHFGLAIFDECHHLPSQIYRCSAEMCCARYRLGLSATPERDDGGERTTYELLGPVVYRREIDEFKRDTLSAYEIKRLEIPLTPEEEQEYKNNRERYKNFLTKYRINFSSPHGWRLFLRMCATQPDGKDAMAAYQRQKKIAAGGSNKFRKLWTLLHKHANERCIVFTSFNALAYEIGDLFILPVLTHLTKGTERKAFLDGFRSGEFNAIVTSRVLNEGIDVPEASVGIIISGTGSVREHVQRLGRILRPREGKRAILYEIISAGTGEFYISQKRRNHRAYQRPSSVFRNPRKG